MTGPLLVLSDFPGRRIELRRDYMVVGRGPACDIRVDAPQVSRAHAALRRRGNAVYVTDLGSSGGTFIGETPVTGSRELRPGDVVSFAGVTARFEPAATAAEQTKGGGSDGWAPVPSAQAPLAPAARLAPVPPVASAARSSPLAPLAHLAPVRERSRRGSSARWLSWTGLLVLAEGVVIVAVTRLTVVRAGAGLLEDRFGPSLAGLPAGLLGWGLATVGLLLTLTGLGIRLRD
jgi:hypothetical protein